MKSILLNADTPFLSNKIFDITDKKYNRDNCLMPYYQLQQSLRSQGYNLQTIDCGDIHSAEYIIFFDLPKNNIFFRKCIEAGLQEKMIFWLLEPPAVSRRNWNRKLHKNFLKVFTWNDALVDNKKYFKIFYPQPQLPATEFISFTQRKLCTLIAGNKKSRHPLELYSERIRAIKAFEKLCPDQFDFYGNGWNKPNQKIQRLFPFLTPHFHSYRGPIADKSAVLSQYKFSICYENFLGSQEYDGYITEKILDCFMSQCVPVYLGASNITTYIPKETFIDKRNFSSYNDLFTYLSNMSAEEHANYLANINRYLNSDLFHKNFSTESFIKLMLKHLIK